MTTLDGKVVLMTGGGRKQPGEEGWERLVRTLIPLGRPQTPEDIGQLAVYLALAPNITGQALNIDGGMELQ